MKIKELVALLLKQDQDAEIIVYDADNERYVDPTVGIAEVVDVHGSIVGRHLCMDGHNPRDIVVVALDA